MDTFKQHEIFEIEVLDRMKSARLLDLLVFGGGTMLRLCHELPRYSVDLDFWFIKKTPHEAYLDRLQRAFEKDFEITDAQIKRFTLLLEVRSPQYPRRLKLEIRREMKECDFQDKIAFSRFASKQVMLRAHTLEQSMKNKIAAFLDRGEIRDCFDIEFMLRRGISLPALEAQQAAGFQKKLAGLKDRDFKVKLGSIVESEARDYYSANRFSYLKEKLSIELSKGDLK
jgi:predicted nucleotidyltransferase component of viral defense system